MNSMWMQFLRYVLAGGAALTTHLVILVLLVEAAEMLKPVSSLIGFLCAIPVNYLLQHRYVFARTSGHGIYIGRYLFVTLGMAVANTVIFAFIVSLDVAPYVIVQISVTALIVIANYLVNRSFTFRT